MSARRNFRLNATVVLAIGTLVVACVYWAGLSGSWLFDDYPNIVDNHNVQPANASLSSLVGAALSSQSSDFKRPLSSLTFAVNYLVGGMDPYSWKLVNLLIHLLNGVAIFMLARKLIQLAPALPARVASSSLRSHLNQTQRAPADVVAALIATGWMLLPINLTAVLYVVQRMESMANLFVLIGLLGYVAGRQRMLQVNEVLDATEHRPTNTRGFLLCITSLIIPTALGALAKETAVMLPLYALVIEWIFFRFRKCSDAFDFRIATLFVVVLLVPMAIGMIWVLPALLQPNAWATRDFTLGTRLLSEARIVVGYIRWTLLPTPNALSFYHDDFRISTGLLTPWTTLASLVMLVVMVLSIFWLRSRRPLAALGIALFLACHLLTGTVLPLELIYEHRNYFSSFGLLLALVPLLAVPRQTWLALPRYLLLAGLLLCWSAFTAMTSYAWGSPLRLAEELAERAPASPRAQYELGRTYIIYSRYDPASPFTPLVYAPLEKSAALPDSSILPEQALIFMNSRMHLPLKDAWWESMIGKLRQRKPGVQDESSLGALTQCARDGECELPKARMVDAYNAALSHSAPGARLQSMYGDYAWNVLHDHDLGERMTAAAVQNATNEPAYRITLARMLVAQGRVREAQEVVQQLQRLNYGGRLDAQIAELNVLTGLK
ncbi:hypothetical protein [Rhodanobacter sp. L36]|uniref:hypothetical protein n=1 Tax=Rhodanobacter sp. L36 TaxID=1747221 RepID=UPI00131D21AE|nr:hypothetical protein [Rhodanobacter sp. L36]